MIKEINIDIFDSDFEVMIHQTNCFVTFAAGLAKTVKEKYPEVYAADRKTTSGDKTKLGTISPVWISKNKYIINCYGQYHYGRDRRQTNYEAYYRCLEKVKNFMIEERLIKLSIPALMGCGLASGSWPICLAMIKDVFENIAVNVTICKL